MQLELSACGAHSALMAADLMEDLPERAHHLADYGYEEDWSVSLIYEYS
jgi:hypothetical protein